MSCEICGRSSCTRSFHSIEEQELHDKSEDELRDEIAAFRADNEVLRRLLKNLVHESLAADFNEHWDSYKEAVTAAKEKP